MNRTARVAGVMLASCGALVVLGGAAQADGSSCTPGSSVNTSSSSCLPTHVLGTTYTKPTDGTVATPADLPFTGADIIPLVVGGVVLLGGGAGLVTAGSRRRRAE